MAVYALIVIFIVIFMPKGMLYYLARIIPGKKNDGR
jgi:ABC-type branched-subunit amino acid transport system permease subunit